MPIAKENGGFAGIMPAIITPMDANGDLDEHAFKAVMEYLLP
jgi:dihydrodipicolinate synthase/N-acetylneuraminate lyase